MNKELETRTDYESDSYMELIENVSTLSEKFYAIDATNYEEDVEKALLGLGFMREDFHRQTSDFKNRSPVFCHQMLGQIGYDALFGSRYPATGRLTYACQNLE